ncbi:MAG: porin [Rhodocyclaceae bacterium]
MQKKLIAAAVAGLIALPALAQTNVTISGALKLGYDNYRYSGGTAGSPHDTTSRVSDQSSQVILSVVEDLGGGLKAWGQIDSRTMAESATGGAGTAGGGRPATPASVMHANWGKTTLGRWDTHYQEWPASKALRAGSLQTPFGHGIMSQISTRAAAGASAVATLGGRAQNLDRAWRPNWNGFTACLGYSTSPAELKADLRGRQRRRQRLHRGVALQQWPLAGRPEPLALEQRAVLLLLGLPDLRGTRAWIGYTFAMGLKVGFGYDHSSINNNPLVQRTWSAPAAPAATPGSSRSPTASARMRGFTLCTRVPATPAVRRLRLAPAAANGRMPDARLRLRLSQRTWSAFCHTQLDNNGSRTTTGLGSTGGSVRHCRNRQRCRRDHEWRGCPPVVHRHGPQLLIDSKSQLAVSKTETAAFGRPFFYVK